jgi:RHS repeat-associated protein
VSAAPGEPGDLPSTSTFAYAGGRFDAARRELRGFSSAVETRPDGSRVERSWAQSDALSGAPLSERVTDAQGRPWLEARWSYLDDDTPPYARLVTRVDRLEWDGAATPRTSRTELRYDGSAIAYGNVTAVVEYGEVDASGADVVPGDTRTSELSYVVNDAAHLVDRVATSRLRAGATPGSGTVLRETRFFYDGDPTGSAPPVRGDLTRRVEVLADAAHPDPATTFDWDAYGNPIAVTSPRSNAGQGGGTTRTEYDARFHTFPTAVVNAAGHRSEIDYGTAPGCAVAHDPGEGLASGERGPNDLAAGTSWLRCYDVFGRPVAETAPANLAAATWSYADAPLASSVTEARRASANGWREVTTRLDGLGRPARVEQSGPLGQTVVTTRAWDARGRLVAESAPGFGAPGPVTEHDYDVLDRVVESRLPGSGRVYATRYDRGVVERSDPLGHATRRIHDAFGRVVRVEEVAGGGTYTTRYGYDPAGSLTSIVDHHGNATTFALDRLGRRRSVQDPDTGATSFDWDANGNLVEQTSGAETVTFAYDALDRPLEKRGRSEQGLESAKVLWRWDTAPNGIGLLALRSDDAVHSVRADGYDLLGRRTQTTHFRRRSHDKQRFTFTDTWDPLGQPLTRTHPTGTEVHWLRDARGFLSAVRSDSSFDASGIEWAPDGRVARWMAPGGVVHERGYDPETRRLASVRVDGPDGERLVDRRYAYDRADRVTQLVDAVDWSKTQLLAYDALGRLVETRRFEGNAWVARSHAYDALGNLLCRDATGPGCAGGQPFAYPTGAQLLAIGHKPIAVAGEAVTHFAGGALRQVGGRRFAYDSFGRLTEAWLGDAQLLDVAYDGSGGAYSVWSAESGERSFTLEPDFEWRDGAREALVQIHLGGLRIATHAIPFAAPPTTPICAGAAPAAGAPGSPLDLLALFAPGLAALALWQLRRASPRRLVAVGTGASFLAVVSVPGSLAGGGAARAQLAGAASLYHHADHLGSTLLVTDAQGRVAGEPAGYEPWGRPLAAEPPTPFGFHGNRRAAGLYDYGARWYDPSLGRFLQPDPVLADPYDPQGLSPYSYVRNDPVNRVDPTGAFSFALSGAFFAGQVDENGFTGFRAEFSLGTGLQTEVRVRAIAGDVDVASYAFREFIDEFDELSRVGAFRLLNTVGTNLSGGVSDRAATRYTGPFLPGMGRARTPDRRDQAILDGLHPLVANLAAVHLRILEILGIDARLGDGFRSYDYQNEKYAVGRRGIPDERVVTHARGGESYHNFGLAYDIKVFDEAGRYIRRGSHPSYRDAGTIGEALGLTWGGRWLGRRNDPSHFQYDKGLPLPTVRERWESGRDPIYGF